MTRLRAVFFLVAIAACHLGTDRARADETFDSHGVRINSSVDHRSPSK